MLAFGSKCSIGDQLHPEGRLDESTYRLIGRAYREVESKEPWCIDALPVADIAVLSSESENPLTHRNNHSDVGACRVLLEGQFLFTVLDRKMPFDPYQLLVLPDDIAVDPSLARKLRTYLKAGGKVLLTGTSGLKPDGSGFALDTGATWSGQSEYQPDFMLPGKALRPTFVDSPFVAYLPSQRIVAKRGRSLGQVYDPYFNRRWDHFCSHQHAPARPEASGYDLGVRHGRIIYLAHPVFTLYQAYGAVTYKEFLHRLLRSILGRRQSLETNLPSTARATLNHQAGEHRYILHLLHAPTIARGGDMSHRGGNIARDTTAIEVVEDLIPIGPVEVALRLPEKLKSVRLVPTGGSLRFLTEKGRGTIRVPRFAAHAMIEIAY